MIKGTLNKTAGTFGLSMLNSENDGLDKVTVDQSFITMYQGYRMK